MDVLDYAIQMEKDGEAYYRQLAHRTAASGLKTVLTMLADEEVKHQRVFDQMRLTLPVTEPSELLTRAKNIFAEMRDGDRTLPDDTGQIGLYKKALELEKASEQFYLDKARLATDTRLASVLRTIALEEACHYRLVQAIIDFVSRPEQWLENAEFSRLDEY